MSGAADADAAHADEDLPVAARRRLALGEADFTGFLQANWISFFDFRTMAYMGAQFARTNESGG